MGVTRNLHVAAADVQGRTSSVLTPNALESLLEPYPNHQHDMLNSH